MLAPLESALNYSNGVQARQLNLVKLHPRDTWHFHLGNGPEHYMFEPEDDDQSEISIEDISSAQMKDYNRKRLLTLKNKMKGKVRRISKKNDEQFSPFIRINPELKREQTHKQNRFMAEAITYEVDKIQQQNRIVIPSPFHRNNEEERITYASSLESHIPRLDQSCILNNYKFNNLNGKKDSQSSESIRERVKEINWPKKLQVFHLL